MAKKAEIKRTIKESSSPEDKDVLKNQGQKTKDKCGRIFAIFATIMVWAVATLTGCIDTQTTSQRLATTTISYNAQTSIVSWTDVPNANGYKVVISSAKLGVNKELNTNKDTKSVELKTYLTASTDDCLISITAKGDGKLYTDSEVAQKTVIYTQVQAQTQEATKLQMGAIRFEQTTRTFSWDAVANASGYKVMLNGVEVQENGTTYQLADKSGTYQLSVTAEGQEVGTGDNKTIYLNSDASVSQSVNYIKTVTLEIGDISYNATTRTFSWDIVANASGYTVLLNNGTVNETVIAVEDGSKMAYTIPADKDTGTYRLIVEANGQDVGTGENLIKYENSTAKTSASVEITKVVQLTTYADVEAALIAKLPAVIKTAHPIGVVSAVEILGINANDGTIFCTYKLGTGDRFATVQALGLNIASQTSYQKIIEGLESEDITFGNINLASGSNQSASNAENLVAMSITNGEFAEAGTTLPSGCTAENLKFATATTFDNNKDTNIIAVFNNGTVLKYKLRVVATSSATAYQEYMTGYTAGDASNITIESNYTELNGVW